jgi:PAS domain S-box-containing protein
MDPQPRSDDRLLQRGYDLLLALSRAQSRFIADADPGEVFGELLTVVLSITDSQYGFLAEVVDPASGVGALQMLATSDAPWDDGSLDTVFNAAIKTAQPVIVAYPPDGGEEGRRPPIGAFLGLPISHHQELVGLLGLANRPFGYDAETTAFLAPVVATCGTLIVAARTDRRRQQAEHALRESETRFRVMADTAPVMIWMSGVDKGCTYFSKTWLDFTGRSLAAELGNGWAEGVHPDDYHRCLAQYAEAFDARRPFRMEYRLRRHDGEYRWLLDTGVPRYYSDGNFSGYIGSCIDITERRQVEDTLRQNEAALRRSEDELRSLAGKLLSAQEDERSALARDLHDDLSQRLAAFAIETAMIEGECGAVPESTSIRLRDLRDRLVEAATDVHHLARQLHPAILQDLGLAEAVRSECVRFAEREGIPVEFVEEHVEDVPPAVAICLYRIVQEGLRNIAKHAQAAQARVTLVRGDHAVVLTIRDSGIGFDPTTASRAEGMGLASLRERAWLVRGDIAIRSQSGHGTVIEVRVPLDDQIR